VRGQHHPHHKVRWVMPVPDITVKPRRNLVPRMRREAKTEEVRTEEGTSL
jgi:ribosomal protein S30